MAGIWNTKTIGGILILAGTSIGAGMLALPVSTGPAGMFYSALLLVFTYFFMSYTMFLLLEVNTASEKKDANLISLVGERLGVTGKAIAWFSCLSLLYAVGAAYMTGGAAITQEALKSVGISLPNQVNSIIVFSFVFALVAMLRTKWVDYFNRFLMIALLLSFFALIIGSQIHTPTYEFEAGQAKYLFAALPVVFLSFCGHPVFPSICSYFANNTSVLTRVILCGGAVPLCCYLVWEMIILGILPQQGEAGIFALSRADSPVIAMTHALEHTLSVNWLSSFVASFSFFALSTSFLAVILSLADFIEDGLGLNNTKQWRWLVILFTVLPPFVFALFYPNGFIIALGYAGIFVAVLYCIFPALMVWKLRYRDKAEASFQAPGGKPVLFIVMLISSVVIICELAATMDLLPQL